MTNDTETDIRIERFVVRYIREASMQEQDWLFTRLQSTNERLSDLLELEVGELPIVACYVDEDWSYLLTSRRVLGRSDGENFAAKTVDVTDWAWGNFKRELRAEVAIAELTVKEQPKICMAYETGYASMAPIHYAKWWRLRYPILHKLAD